MRYTVPVAELLRNRVARIAGTVDAGDRGVGQCGREIRFNGSPLVFCVESQVHQDVTAVAGARQCRLDYPVSRLSVVCAGTHGPQYAVAVFRQRRREGA